MSIPFIILSRLKQQLAAAVIKQLFFENDLPLIVGFMNLISSCKFLCHSNDKQYIGNLVSYVFLYI